MIRPENLYDYTFTPIVSTGKGHAQSPSQLLRNSGSPSVNVTESIRKRSPKTISASLQKRGTQNSGFKGSMFNSQQLNNKFTSAIILLVVLKLSIPGTGEPGGLPSMGSHRVGHD